MMSLAHTRRGVAIVDGVLFCLIALSGPFTSLAAAPATPAHAQTPSSPGPASPMIILVGFVGGFVRSNDDRHPEVQIVQRLSEEDGPKLHAMVFENRHRAKAREKILRWLGTDGDGHLSAQERQDARIILFGHSWGGSAAIKLARDLDRRGIPVLLTIQVDSVNKGWGDDCVIPDNVGQAVNFYQTRGPVHGCRAIRAADPHRTRILGNYRFEYSAQPARCHSYPWFDRHFFKTHNAMGCDPVVWAQVEDEIRERLRSSTDFQEVQGTRPLVTNVVNGKH